MGGETSTDRKIDILPTPKRVRVMLGGDTLADSLGAVLLREPKHMPVYYFPSDDVRQDLLTPTEHRTRCPLKGEASYWSIAVGDRWVENAVWSYRDPIPEAAAIAGMMAFYWDRMDAWLEEDEEVFVHPRDPFVRIDVRDSRRRVTVRVGDTLVADTRRARFLFETGLPVRYYIPRDDVRTDLLVQSDRRSGCPYKGFARWWSLGIGETLRRDLVWSYPEPFEDALRVKDYLCFYQERVDALTVEAPG